MTMTRDQHMLELENLKRDHAVAFLALQRRVVGGRDIGLQELFALYSIAWRISVKQYEVWGQKVPDQFSEWGPAQLIAQCKETK